MLTESPTTTTVRSHRAPSVGRWAVDLDPEALDRPALQDAAGTLTHAELDRAVDRAAAHLPPVETGRRLVHLPVRRDRASVIAHLAVQRAGHVGVLLDGQRDGADPVAAAWEPDLRATGGLDLPFEAVSRHPLHLLHDDLALLLSTSGSTGSAKLVRLSHDNLTRNASGIATTLGLRPDDRGALSLPLHYCFGLSVVHSHLVAGASIALSAAPVTEAVFWDEVGPVTTLPVVPHTLDLLHATGWLEHLPPSLRLVTQAGGALSPTTAELARAAGRRAGWDLVVMYGQTEATARMTVLPPGVPTPPAGAVGWPLPDSAVRIDLGVPEAADGVGEIVFTGPGVMLGYAHEAADLALGDWTPELRTGDLGWVEDTGMVHVTGRRSAVAKVMGLRLDLSLLEGALRDAGTEACVTSDDTRLLVAATAGSLSADAVVTVVTERTGLPRHLVECTLLERLPRTTTGKVDRQECTRRVLATRRTADPTASDDRQAQVLAALGRALGRPAVAERSFAAQGGDSFSVVQAALALEDLLGPLPRGWQHRPVQDLLAAAPDRPATRRSWHWLETPVVVRAVAALVIVATHLGLVNLPGGAHALLVVAGYHLALFPLASSDRATRLRRLAGLFLSVALPAGAVALAVHLTTGDYGWANVVQLNWLLGTVEWGPRIELWFVEALLASLVLVAGLTGLPGLHRWWARRPWAGSMVVAAVALVPRFLLVPDATGPTRGLPATVFWLVAVGLALGAARTTTQRLTTLALLGAGLVTFFETPARGLTTFALAALVALAPRLPVPRLLVPAAGAVAAASLHIYLVQFQVFGRVPNPLLALVVAVLLGLVLARLSDPVVRAVTHRVLTPSPRPSRSAPAGGRPHPTMGDA